ncbi:MAG: hypothetical protein COB02_01105 [Candidatus Cloacimonadota bacterium]|nr:MAG: hypothetical protein COB02_01105 [Candidatus Cloacimonadota bacterium]
MKYGLKSIHISKINKVFSEYSQIQKVVLYGSRAKGNFKNGSDIDLTMYGENLELGLLFKIENKLDDLLLAYTIDLSIFNNIDNKSLIEHINRVGICFYTKKRE